MLAGMYKVISGNDPTFPQSGAQEWFLDFGRGVTAEKLSGTVAVTLRENPSLRVRILVWQYYPAEGFLRLGHQAAEGSRQAVMLAQWQVAPASAGALLLQRGSYQVLLKPAQPTD